MSIADKIVEIRTRTYLENEDAWNTVRYLGAVYPQQLQTSCRSIFETQVSDNVETFLELVGFKYQYEYVKEGTRFHVLTDKSTVIELYISKLKKVQERGNLKNLVDEYPNAYFVEAQSLVEEREMPSVAQEVAELFMRLASGGLIEFRRS